MWKPFLRKPPAPPAAIRARPAEPAPVDQEGPARAAILDDLAGGRDFLHYLRYLARGNAYPQSELPAAVDAERPPVLLIHGFMGTRGSMILLERRLMADGHAVFSFDLGLINTHDIRASAVRIQRKIESILEQVSVDRIDIVGHSMGGLIGLYYIKRLGGGPKVRKLVMMGTPIQGTWSAVAGVATLGLVSPSSWQILPGSRFLRELREGPLPDGVSVYTIAAERDWVCPPASTVMGGATRITVPLGHSSLVVSDDAYARVRAALGGR